MVSVYLLAVGCVFVRCVSNSSPPEILFISIQVILRVERGPAGSTSEQVILEARGSSCRLVGAGPYQNSDVFCKGTLA